MKRKQVDQTKSGIYSVYWDIKDGESGGTTTTVFTSAQRDTPNKIKALIAQTLLEDLGIPIRIDEHLVGKK